jgi:hypothetical protein
VASKRDATPPAPVERRPIDHHGLGAALRLFVTGFVVEDKRAQIHQRLLAAARRLETLGTLPRWIAVRTAPLEGADRSPAGLRARFGDLLGVHLDTGGACRTTIAGALELGRKRASLFVADTGRLALITAEDGAALLCSR